jgi:hypothetical protein
MALLNKMIWKTLPAEDRCCRRLRPNPRLEFRLGADHVFSDKASRGQAGCYGLRFEELGQEKKSREEQLDWI